MVNHEVAQIAERVKKSMQLQGVSELKLAEQTGIARTTLRRKLQGRIDFSIGELIIISQYMNVDLGAWLDGFIGRAAA